MMEDYFYYRVSADRTKVLELGLENKSLRIFSLEFKSAIEGEDADI